jgi:hypothetical protein
LRARVVEMLDKEGESDPGVAFERAVMEEMRDVADQGGAVIGDHIEGFDVPDDGGAASPPGEHTGDDRNPGGEAGGDAFARGRGDDRTPAGVPDWQGLRDLGQEPDRDLIAASDDAAKASEPPADPEKAQTQAEAAAADADWLLADLLPQLSDEERALFEERLADLAKDGDERAEVMRQAAILTARRQALCNRRVTREVRKFLNPGRQIGPVEYGCRMPLRAARRHRPKSWRRADANPERGRGGSSSLCGVAAKTA